MRFGPRHIGLLLAIAVMAIGGALLADLGTRRELEPIRGARVAIEARAAIEGGTPREGSLTVVKETESAKYPFLNKRRYVVHTASTAREGTVLSGSDPTDKARADRHSEARRKKTLKTRLEGGSWRATVAEETTTAEFIADPPEVARPSVASSALVALAIATLVLLLVAVRRSSTAAGLWGVGAAAVITYVFAERHLTEASLFATDYLRACTPSPPSVTLPRAGVRASLGALALVDLSVVLLAFSGRGASAARALIRDRGAYAAIAPALLGLGLLVGIPFAFGIGLSLFEHEHGKFTFVGLDNFIRIFHPSDRSLFAPGSLVYALFVNVVWTVSNVSLHLLIGLALALLLQRFAAGLSRLYRVLLILPWAVPAYLTALIWKAMFDADVGAINRLLGLEGMSWMHRPSTAFLANLMTNVWLGFPFMMVVCLGALTSIPKDLYEAAEVDGASGLEQFSRITLPLLKPALLPAVILGSIWTFNRFEVIYLVSEGRPDGATDILVTEAYRWAFERGLAQGGAYGYAAAYSVVIFTVLLVYGWMTSRVARAAEEALR